MLLVSLEIVCALAHVFILIPGNCLMLTIGEIILLLLPLLIRIVLGELLVDQC